MRFSERLQIELCVLQAVNVLWELDWGAKFWSLFFGIAGLGFNLFLLGQVIERRKVWKEIDEVKRLQARLRSIIFQDKLREMGL